MTTLSGSYPFQLRANVQARLVAGERYLVELLQRFSIPVLRVAMSLVFFWFGALKVADVTPVGDLVADTLPFLDRHWLVPGMGVLEVLLGVGLLARWRFRIILLTMIGHLSGTFLVLLVLPNLAFQQGNPLLLTTTGEFVVKNLVLIAAAMVLLAWTGRRPARATGSA